MLLVLNSISLIFDSETPYESLACVSTENSTQDKSPSVRCLKVFIIIYPLINYSI